MFIRTNIVFLTFLVSLLTACSSPSAEFYYRQGRQLRDADEPVEAMNAFIAATRVHSREYTFKARSYSNMATMCRIGERHDLAYALYEQSLLQFMLAHDTLAQAYALNNMAWEKAVLGDKPAAMLLIDSALTVCSDTAVQHKVLESRAAACLYAAEYDSVLFYANSSPMNSEYFDILCAQAHTFLANYDSALYYAKRVVPRTSNPRYLDDVYYILTQCDSSVVADDLRLLSSKRTDVQRSLERNSPKWIEAMLLAEKALEPQPHRISPETCVLLACIFLALLGVGIPILLWRRKQLSDTLEKQCRALRKCPNLREELHWNDYLQFSIICNNRLSGIVDKLDNKGFSEREIRLSVLVLIGLTYAQMAEVLIRAENGIGKDKYLVAKHLGVSVKDLQTTLRRIANEPIHA